jgi:hypothetical protein
MTDYKATPEQWEVQEEFAPESDNACCLLELRSRIERLELGAGIHNEVKKTIKETYSDCSPAVQAILDAYQLGPIEDGPSVAAVLRALADQLQMDKPLGETDADVGVFAAHHAIYAQILVIAEELETI